MPVDAFTTKKQRADQIWAFFVLDSNFSSDFYELRNLYADVKLASKLSQYYPVYLR